MSDVKQNIASFEKNLEFWSVLLCAGFSLTIFLHTKNSLFWPNTLPMILAICCWPLAVLVTRQFLILANRLSFKTRAGFVILLSALAIFTISSSGMIWLESTCLGVLSGMSAYIIRLLLMRPILDWQLMQDILLERDATDIQRNFISLLSHNLNTPIAKLAGTLGVLEREQPHNHQLVEAKSALRRLQFYVRGTLQTATLLNKDHKIIAAQPLVGIIETIKEGLAQLRQINGQHYPLALDGRDQEMMSLPLYFDGPQISQFVAGSIYSIGMKDGNILCHLENSGVHAALIFTIGVKDGLSPDLLTPTAGESYLTTLCKRHISEILKLYRGSVVAEKGHLILKLQALTPGSS
jgi:hypothetical protein